MCIFAPKGYDFFDVMTMHFWDLSLLPSHDRGQDDLVFYINLLIFMICWLLRCTLFVPVLIYCHNLLRSGYNLLDPTVSAKMFLSQMDRTLSPISKGLLLCQMTFLIVTCQYLWCIWIRRGGGGSTCKRHSDTQVRVRFRAINDVKWIFKWIVVLPWRAFPFIYWPYWALGLLACMFWLPVR